ncbi:hypothetical protein [Pedobacter sp. N23S346]|uniref:hypothetical protein n=1 Tax=Pedobacter sp. N23S346 TaxID=3402750 RepID=UPI003AC4C21A
MDNQINILMLFLKYMLFAGILLAISSIIGETVYYGRFKVDILELAGPVEVLMSHRTLSIWGQLIFLLAVPLVISIIFIGHCWLRDILSVSFCRKLFFVLGILPMIWLLASMLNNGEVFFTVWPAGVMVLTISLWLVFYHVRQFEIRYFSMHVFFLFALILAHAACNNADTQAAKCLNSPSDCVYSEPSCILKNSVFIGCIGEWDMYYDRGRDCTVLMPQVPDFNRMYQ